MRCATNCLSSILCALVMTSSVWLGGCGSSVTSSLTVDGASFQPNDCRSGQDREFLGADLRDDSGVMLRLVVEPDQTATILLFPVEGQGSVTFKGCGVVSSIDPTMTSMEIIRSTGRLI
jgi:hypothetical protein